MFFSRSSHSSGERKLTRRIGGGGDALLSIDPFDPCFAVLFRDIFLEHTQEFKTRQGEHAQGYASKKKKKRHHLQGRKDIGWFNVRDGRKRRIKKGLVLHSVVASWQEWEPPTYRWVSMSVYPFGRIFNMCLK